MNTVENAAGPWRPGLATTSLAGDACQHDRRLLCCVSGSHKLFNPTRRQALRATFARTA